MKARTPLIIGLALAAAASAAPAAWSLGKSDREPVPGVTQVAMNDQPGTNDPAPPPPPRPDMPERGPRGFGPGHPGMFPPPHMLARMLSDQETLIGIRSNQLDAWRDYADALQAMLAPPKPPADRPDRSEPFAMAQAIAGDVAARADAAKKVQSAIQTLKSVLTPEQLERAARFAPPPPPMRDHPPFGPDAQPRGPRGEPGPGPSAPL